MAEKNWLLNDTFPLGLAQQFNTPSAATGWTLNDTLPLSYTMTFATPASAWSATYWGPFEIAFNAAQSGGAVYTYAASGGALAGGAADPAKIKVPAISGGIATGGAALVAKTKNYTAAGGGQSSGTALTQFVAAGGVTYAYVASGGALAAGAGDTIYSAAPAAPQSGDGRVWRRLSAEPLLRRRAFAASGGVRVGGNARIEFISAPAVAASAPLARVYSCQPSGGVHIGGAAHIERVDGAAIRRRKQNALIFLLEAA